MKYLLLLFVGLLIAPTLFAQDLYCPETDVKVPHERCWQVPLSAFRVHDTAQTATLNGVAARYEGPSHDIYIVDAQGKPLTPAIYSGFSALSDTLMVWKSSETFDVFMDHGKLTFRKLLPRAHARAHTDEDLE